MRQTAPGVLAATVGSGPPDPPWAGPEPSGLDAADQSPHLPLHTPDLIAPGNLALHAIDDLVRYRFDEITKRDRYSGRPPSTPSPAMSCHVPSLDRAGPFGTASAMFTRACPWP
jgi:hypothetical protein